MFSMLYKRTNNQRGFNMIELMVVVVIIGILAAIAVPIYSKYAKNARVSEVTGRMGDILTAAKSYATENDPGTGPTHWVWPANCAATNFIGDCTASANVSGAGYVVAGATDGDLTITATGANKLTGVTVVMTVTGGPTKNGTIAISGL